MAVVAVVLGLNEMFFALAPQGGRPTEATCAFAGALVNVLGVNVLGFGVWTLIYAAPRWDALVLGPARGAPIPIAPKMARPVWRSVPVHAQWRSFPDHARPRHAALYASYGLLVGFHTLAFWKTAVVPRGERRERLHPHVARHDQVLLVVQVQLAERRI